jgi:hypothetical protein
VTSRTPRELTSREPVRLTDGARGPAIVRKLRSAPRAIPAALVATMRKW